MSFVQIPSENAQFYRGLAQLIMPMLKGLVKAGFKPSIQLVGPNMLKLVLFREVNGNVIPAASLLVNAREGTVKVYSSVSPQLVSERLPQFGYFEIIITPEGEVKGYCVPLSGEAGKVELTREELEKLLAELTPLINIGKLALAYLQGKLNPLLPTVS